MARIDPSKLTLEERHVYENVLSYLTTSDILAMRNIGLAVMEKMSARGATIPIATDVYTLARSLNATYSGEHGDGRRLGPGRGVQTPCAVA